MTTAPDQTQPPPRHGRAAAIARDAGTAGGGAFARMGFRDPSLVLRWREIAGPDVARLCQPVRLSEGAAGGTLTLKALPGAALFLGHETRALTGRINAYLGREAVTRLKFVQGALHPRPPRPLPPKPATALAATDPAQAFKGPETVKAALETLARWRHAR